MSSEEQLHRRLEIMSRNAARAESLTDDELASEICDLIYADVGLYGLRSALLDEAMKRLLDTSYRFAKLTGRG